MTWLRIIQVQVIGFLAAGRGFAYLGIPALNLFPGEVVLAGFMLLRPREIFGRWVEALAGRTAISGFAAALTGFLAFGCLEALRGILLEHPALTTAQNLVFNYYPLYFFLGLWAAKERPGILERFIPAAAWIHGIYGIAYFVVLIDVPVYLPGGEGVRLLGEPKGGAVMTLAMLCMPGSGPRKWIPVALNAMVLVGVQSRGEWLSFVVALVLWGIAARQIPALMMRFALIVVLLVIGFITDAELPGAIDRGGNVTVRASIGRVLAPLDKDLAKDYNAAASGYAGTVTWRTEWWREIWRRVHDSPETTALGLGYGFPLGDLVPYLRARVIRTPHNVFLYTLGYTGWVGLLAFAWLQIRICMLGWRVLRRTGDPFGLVVWGQALVGACFNAHFETPFCAIPTYVLLGMAIAPLMSAHSASDDYLAAPQLLPAVRG